MAPVARIGPPALNPTPLQDLIDLSGLKAMPILRGMARMGTTRLSRPVVGAPKLGFTLFDRPHEARSFAADLPKEWLAVFVFLAMAAPKLVEMRNASSVRILALPSFKSK